MIPLPVYLFLLIELLAVSYGDIKTNKIPNAWAILNLALFPVLLFVAPSVYALSGEAFLFSGAFLLVGFVLFLLNIMGGGDSKFLFTFFLLLPVSVQDQAFYYLLISTVLIGGFFFIKNIFQNHDILWRAMRTSDIKAVKSCFGTKFSFAPVILVAWIWLGWELKDKF